MLGFLDQMSALHEVLALQRLKTTKLHLCFLCSEHPFSKLEGSHGCMAPRDLPLCTFTITILMLQRLRGRSCRG